MRRALVKDRAAGNDLIEIYVFTFRNWGEGQAEKYLDILEAAIRSIGDDPTAGRSRDEVRAGYWSKSVERHVVFYTFNETEVRIRRVLHASMDFDARLSE